MEYFLSSSLVAALPLLFAALGGLVAERAGVLNIGLDGTMLLGAFTAALAVGGGEPSIFGLFAAIASGALVGLVIGWILVVLRADQVVIGIAFNIFMLGFTGYLFTVVTAGRGIDFFSVTYMETVRVPVLSGLPVVGRMFDQHWLLYFGIALVPVTSYILFRTGLGIRLIACGESSEGARTSGINVIRMRIGAMVVSGILAAVGGAFLVLADAGRFGINMTDGRGYMALAIIILARWTPFGVLLAAGFFGMAISLEFFLMIQRINIPLEVIQALPFVAVLAAVALFGRRSRPPAEEGRPLMLSD